MNIRNTKWYAKRAYRKTRNAIRRTFVRIGRSEVVKLALAVLIALLAEDAVRGVLAWITRAIWT